MVTLSTALLEKLMKAQNLEEVTELLKAEGRNDISAEEIWENLGSLSTQGKEMYEVSREEMEAVSGGYDRNWLKQGCAATVEPESNCWKTDMCNHVNVTYNFRPSKNYSCPLCGGVVSAYNHSQFDSGYNLACPKCGKFIVLPFIKQTYKIND